MLPHVVKCLTKHVVNKMLKIKSVALVLQLLIKYIYQYQGTPVVM